jgi:putative intracellular protease/amidase
MPRILFLVSSARQMPLAGGSPYVTGFFAAEALIPYERFVAAGVDVVVATPDGELPFADPYGLEQSPANLSEMSEEQMGEFDAVFAPGGHAPMVDLADNPDVTRLLGTLHRKRAPIASLDHGPAMLLSAPANTDGQWLFDGYRMTAFTDEEESQTPSGKLGMPWYLETALRNAGAVFDGGRSAWSPHVVVDRNLITGQNPNSADAVATAVLKSLDVL